MAFQFQVGMSCTLVQRLTRLGPFAFGGNLADVLEVLLHFCRLLHFLLNGLFFTMLIDGRFMTVGQLEQKHGLLRRGIAVALGYAFQPFDVDFLQHLGIGVVLYISQRFHAPMVNMSTHCSIGVLRVVAGKLLQLAELP